MTHDETEVFSASQAVLGGMDMTPAGGSRVAVAFDIPAGVPGREEGGRIEFEWTLTATAVLPGVDFNENFDVPIYAVQDSSWIEVNPAF